MTFRWGTVTDDDPLRIRLDGDVAELPFTPDSLIDPATLVVGNRVRVEMAGGTVIIHGRSGGLVLGQWQSFSPTINNLTLGNGTIACSYAEVGDVVFAKYLVLFGSTTSVTGTLSVELVNGDSQGSSTTEATQAEGFLRDVSTSDILPLLGYRSNNTTVQIRYPVPVTTGTARTATGPVSSTTPITLATGDSLYLYIRYRRA